MGHVTAFLRALLTRRTWAELGYVLAAAPLALAGFAFAAFSLLLGVVFAATFVGLPLLALSGFGCRGLGTLQRRLAGALLGERVAPPPRFASGRGLLGWLQAALRYAPGWRARAYLLVRFPLAVLTLYAAFVLYGVGLSWLAYPIWWRRSGPGIERSSVLLDAGALVFRGGSRPSAWVPHRLSWHAGDLLYADTWPRALVVALGGLLMVLAAPWIVRALVWLDRLLIRRLLGPPGVSARVRELERARAHVVDDSAATLRRIERDLHDGTQAQLATLAMTLGQAKEKLEHRPRVPFDPAGALVLVDTAHRHAKEALTDLRDIARGIHPPALDVGLDAALATLAGRSGVPTAVRADIPARPARAIETIAYFSASELLANVGRHSGARRAAIDVSARDGTLCLAVSDDGIGGARIGGGSGLAGLAERVRSVDGRLTISSPSGGPTVVRVELPFHT